MSLFRRRIALLHVTSEDNAQVPFEGTIVYGGRRTRAENIFGQTPYSRILPDRAVTIVVAPTRPDDRVAVLYEVTRGGRQVLVARTRWPIAVIHRESQRVIAAGMNGPFPDDGGDAGNLALLRS